MLGSTEWAPQIKIRLHSLVLILIEICAHRCLFRTAMFPHVSEALLGLAGRMCGSWGLCEGPMGRLDLDQQEEACLPPALSLRFRLSSYLHHYCSTFRRNHNVNNPAPVLSPLSVSLFPLGFPLSLTHAHVFLFLSLLGLLRCIPSQHPRSGLCGHVIFHPDTLISEFNQTPSRPSLHSFCSILTPCCSINQLPSLWLCLPFLDLCLEQRCQNG